jgi:manganese efflux pump family protein
MAKLIVLILPLGLDTFVVAATLGLAAPPARDRLRVSLLFSAFEGAMPLIGLALGAPLGRTIGASADYVAIAVLLAFGLYTLLSRDDEDGEQLARLANARGIPALLLGLSVSIDELAIGFTLGLLRVPVIPVIIAIALQAFAFTQLGMRLGSHVSHRAREGAERLAGLALTTLAMILFVERLLA